MPSHKNRSKMSNKTKRKVGGKKIDSYCCGSIDMTGRKGEQCNKAGLGMCFTKKKVICQTQDGRDVTKETKNVLPFVGYGRMMKDDETGCWPDDESENHQPDVSYGGKSNMRRTQKFKKSSKKIKGGLFGRVTSLVSGKGVSAQTYCCDSKKSNGNTVLAGDNVGTKCHPSYTGQCNIGYGTGQNYKFRCFNPETKEFRETIEETSDLRNDGERCEYVTGMLSKLAKVPLGVGETILNVGSHGGRKSRKRRTKKSKK
jgi:hypothetical protein